MSQKSLVKRRRKRKLEMKNYKLVTAYHPKWRKIRTVDIADAQWHQMVEDLHNAPNSQA